jgi:hypothetical protein
LTRSTKRIPNVPKRISAMISDRGIMGSLQRKGEVDWLILPKPYS